MTFNKKNETTTKIITYFPEKEYLSNYTLDKKTPFIGKAIYEPTNFDISNLNVARKTTCTHIHITYCNAHVTDGAENITHIAGPGCNPDYMWTEAYTICYDSPEKIVSPNLAEGNNDSNNNNTGGGGAGAGKPSTAPLVPCDVGGNDISDGGLCFSDEPLDLGILADLTNSQYNWITTNLTAKNYLENLLNTKLNLENLKLFTAKVIDILKKDKNPNILTTKLENELFVGLVGELLHSKNSNIFFEFNTIFNNLDTSNLLSVSDWQLMSSKINDIHSISLLNNINNQTQFDQLSVFDQKLVIQNSLFINFLPDFKSLGDSLPKSAEEWKALAKILTPFLLEVGLSAIPGAELAFALRDINNGDYTSAGIEVASFIATLVGGKIITVGVKLYKKIKLGLRTFKIVSKYLPEIVSALNKGLKTKLVDDIVHLADDLDNTVAKIKDDVVEIIAEKGLKLADPNSLKKLTKIDPTPSGFINSAKLADAKKFKPSESGLKADFDNLKNLDNNQLGLQSETLANKLFKQDDYLSFDAKIPGFNGNNGFDGVYIKKDASGNVTDIIINEVKQVNSGAIKLSPASTTGLPRQMTDNWITNVTQRMIDLNTPQNVKDLASLINDNLDKVTKVVTGIDKTKGEILVFPIN